MVCDLAAGRWVLEFLTCLWNVEGSFRGTCLDLEPIWNLEPRTSNLEPGTWNLDVECAAAYETRINSRSVVVNL